MRSSGQYWVKIKWPAAVNGYIWTVANYAAGGKGVWFFPGLKKGEEDIIEVDEEKLVYIEQQYRTKPSYYWPEESDVKDGDYSTTALLKAARNIGEILQDIHHQLVIFNQKK